MYKSDFNFEDNMEEETNKLVLNITTDAIKELQQKFTKEVFNQLSDDSEEWLFERYDNVRRNYFDGVVAFLLKQKHTYIKDEKTLENWLSGIGYTQECFRQKIYEDNKEVINKSITYDAVYETLKNMFNHSYFKSWNFKDITINYPQTEIIKSFLKELIKQNGFNEEIKKMLDLEVSEKLNHMSELRNQICELQNKVTELQDKLEIF